MCAKDAGRASGAEPLRQTGIQTQLHAKKSTTIYQSCENAAVSETSTPLGCPPGLQRRATAADGNSDTASGKEVDNHLPVVRKCRCLRDFYNSRMPTGPPTQSHCS